MSVRVESLRYQYAYMTSDGRATGQS